MAALLSSEMQDTLQEHILTKLPAITLCRLRATCKTLASCVDVLSEAMWRAAIAQHQPQPDGLTREQALARVGRYESAKQTIRQGRFQEQESRTVRSDCAQAARPSRYSQHGTFLAFYPQAMGFDHLHIAKLETMEALQMRLPIRSTHAWLQHHPTDDAHIRIAWAYPRQLRIGWDTLHVPSRLSATQSYASQTTEVFDIQLPDAPGPTPIDNFSKADLYLCGNYLCMIAMNSAYPNGRCYQFWDVTSGSVCGAGYCRYGILNPCPVWSQSGTFAALACVDAAGNHAGVRLFDLPGVTSALLPNTSDVESVLAWSSVGMQCLTDRGCSIIDATSGSTLVQLTSPEAVMSESGLKVIDAIGEPWRVDVSVADKEWPVSERDPSKGQYQVACVLDSAYDAPSISDAKLTMRGLCWSRDEAFLFMSVGVFHVSESGFSEQPSCPMIWVFDAKTGRRLGQHSCLGAEDFAGNAGLLWMSAAPDGCSLVYVCGRHICVLPLV